MTRYIIELFTWNEKFEKKMIMHNSRCYLHNLRKQNAHRILLAHTVHCMHILNSSLDKMYHSYVHWNKWRIVLKQNSWLSGPPKVCLLNFVSRGNTDDHLLWMLCWKRKEKTPPFYHYMYLNLYFKTIIKKIKIDIEIKLVKIQEIKM